VEQQMRNMRQKLEFEMEDLRIQIHVMQSKGAKFLNLTTTGTQVDDTMDTWRDNADMDQALLLEAEDDHYTSHGSPSFTCINSHRWSNDACHYARRHAVCTF
jgi:hypothetical protein